MMDFLENLNPAQKEAVTHGDGPLLIVAGAGTGKTTVLVSRIAWLILTGKAKPQEILAMTFTEKAAGEMEERVDRLLPYGYADLWISTFHAFCDRVLKQHAMDIGLPGDYKLFNQTEQWLLVRNNLERFNLDYYRPLGNPTKFIHSLLKHFSRAKDELVTPEEYLKYAQGQKMNTDSPHQTSPRENTRGEGKSEGADIQRLEEVANAYHVYQNLLLENNALDFGDLVNCTLRLFQARPHLLRQYTEQFHYILVDEFQDTNLAQYELIKLLASPRHNVTVVGDDDQSIYKFRGASISNILHFKQDYSDAREIFLTENYRNFQNILDASYAFIQQNNPNRLEWRMQQEQETSLSKKLKATRAGSGALEFLSGETAMDEGRIIMEKILELQKANTDASWDDYAVLVRANDHAEAIIKVFEQAGIPHQYVASRGLYLKPVILDTVAYLKLLDDYHEGPAMWRVLNFPFWKIPQEDLTNLSYWAGRRAWSLYETLRRAPELGAFSPEVLGVFAHITGLIEKHSRLTRSATLPYLIYAFLEESGYLKHAVDEKTSREQISFLNQFYKKIQEFEFSFPHAPLKEFLRAIDLELQSGETGTLETDLDSGPETVKILTVHSAKGLEWRYVFIVNLVDRRFPTSERAETIELPPALIREVLPEGDVHLEEERRLFYVAMTRARDGLYFTAAENYGGVRKRKQSRFLVELGIVEAPAKEKARKTESSRADFPNMLMSQAVHESAESEQFPLPQKFSFTQLKAFENCPLQYKFAHILRVPVRGHGMFSFGRTIHQTLAAFYTELAERALARQKDLFGGKDAVPSLKKEGLLALYEKNWIDDWYASASQKEEYHSKGKKLLEDFFSANCGEGMKLPLHIEQGFNLKIGDITMKGAIDRVDLAEGGVEIIDYKTGSPKKEGKTDNRQLIIYHLAAKEVFGYTPVKLTYYYVESGDKISFVAGPKDEAEVREKIQEMAGQIRRSGFAATPSTQTCKFCDFKEICDFRAL
ncbi:MAG: UvrD-helicase domain-containing protein [Patescibacteria group bacterium]